MLRLRAAYDTLMAAMVVGEKTRLKKMIMIIIINPQRACARGLQ